MGESWGKSGAAKNRGRGGVGRGKADENWVGKGGWGEEERKEGGR